MTLKRSMQPSFHNGPTPQKVSLKEKCLQKKGKMIFIAQKLTLQLYMRLYSRCLQLFMTNVLKQIANFNLLLQQLHTTYCQVCDKRQLSHVSQEEFTSICQLIEARGIVSIKQAKNLRMAKVIVLSMPFSS